MAQQTIERVNYNFDEVDLGYTDAMQPIVLAGLAAGYSEDELFQSLQPIRREREHQILEVDGVQFQSTRVQVGYAGDTAASRGGLEATDAATPYKIGTKATAMAFKHVLLQTGNIGGKGGIVITQQQWDELGEAGRNELFRQHGISHDISPYLNITATDLRTGTSNMDAIADGRRGVYGKQAGAAASGVSERWGGMPNLHAVRTGLGGAIVLAKYLQYQASAGNSRIVEALNGGNPLPMLVQGAGKAGMHFISNMPCGTTLNGVMEWAGGIVSEDPLDPVQVLKQKQLNGLGSESQSALGGRWMPANQLGEFWQAGDGFLVPAFNKDQFSAQDAANVKEGTVLLSIANDPVPFDVQAKLPDRGIQEIVSAFASSGGTLSSRLLWDKWFDAKWTPESYVKTWTARMESVCDHVFSKHVELQRERGEFVPVAEVVDTIVAVNAIKRFRKARAV